MIRKATLHDLNQIEALTEEAKQLMIEDNNPQWDHRYPLNNHFKTDIEMGGLYVYDDSEIKGFIVIDQNAPDWYMRLNGQLINRMLMSFIALSHRHNIVALHNN